MYIYDEEKLRQELQILPLEKVVAFALACSERLFPNYLAFHKERGWGQPEVLRDALDTAWEWLSSGKRPKQVSKLIAKLETVTPDTEEFDSGYVSPALDAAVAVASVIELILGAGLDKALEIASLARDTVDMFVQEFESMEPGEPGLEERILKHSLMQAELMNQTKDMTLLTSDVAFDAFQFKSLHRAVEGNIP